MIGLIAAMPEESRALLRQLLIWEASRLGPFPAFRFRLGEQDCLLVESGIGLERARETTLALLAEGPEKLLSFGVAGAARVGLAIGDVVAIGHTCRLEDGIAGPLLPLAALTGAARRAAEQVLLSRGARLFDGVALTTRGEQVLREETIGLENPVLEMETAGIASAAAQAGVPLLALRGISDNPQEPLPLDPGTVLDEEYRLKIGKLIGILLRRPYLLPQLGRFRRNTTLAAENTACAVLAVISAMQT